MYYSSVAALALIINFIINSESMKNVAVRVENWDRKKKASVYYSQFLLVANLYFIVEMAWGLLYEYHKIPAVFPLIYSDTVFVFIFMLLTMLTWAQYIVAYLDEGRMHSVVLLYYVRITFLFGIIYLLFNRFSHFIFYFNEEHEYIPGSGRYITFFLQIAFFAITSTYMLYISFKSIGNDKVKYRAVALTSIAMGAFLILQIMFAYMPFYIIGVLIGICIVHSYVEAGEKKEKVINSYILSAMAKDYEVIYYIDIETGEYLEFSKSKKYDSMNVPTVGKNFYEEAIKNIETYVHLDDRAYASSFYTKEAIMKLLEGKHSFSYKYRVLVHGKPRVFLFTIMRASDERYLILYEKDIEDELKAELLQKESYKKTATFTQIAESLASSYDDIYYVNVVDNSFVAFEVNNIYGQLEVNKEGSEFWEESNENIPKIVHKQDREMLKDFMNKDSLITALDNRRGCSLNYRLVVNGKAKYVRMTVHKTSDSSHFIIGIENIDNEIKKERQRLKELKTEKELARRDELTGIKNKTAYKELMESVQSNIDNDMNYQPFALVVCDTNNLKYINDTLGHAAGDEYIKASARLLCDTFVHSPVFRIGGDEFVAFLRGKDYASRVKLMDELRAQVIENQNSGTGAVLASGIAEYDPDKDKTVAEIFERADSAMYENKRKLKEMTLGDGVKGTFFRK